MSKSGPHTRKPPAARPSPAKSVVTRFGLRRRSTGADPARAAASLNPEARRLLGILKDTIDQLPDMDATRLVQLYQRLDAGEYEIDAERVAEKLMALEKKLNK